MKNIRGGRLRLAIVPVWALPILLLAACTQGEATGASDRLPVPSPVSGVIRQDCDTIARSDYFLSTEEEDWFTENCDRDDCTLIRGTEYRSPAEREWYLENCR